MHPIEDERRYPATGGDTIAMKDVTNLMDRYRECSRNLWNVYFAGRHDTGAALDTFEEIRRSLFCALVADELRGETQREQGANEMPVLRIVPRLRSPILISRPNKPGEASYWDQERNMTVGEDDITLHFVDYFDFFQAPIKDFRYLLCKIKTFPRHPEYEERQALLEAVGATVVYDH